MNMEECNLSWSGRKTVNDPTYSKATPQIKKDKKLKKDSELAFTLILQKHFMLSNSIMLLGLSL